MGKQPLFIQKLKKNAVIMLTFYSVSFQTDDPVTTGCSDDDDCAIAAAPEDVGKGVKGAAAAPAAEEQLTDDDDSTLDEEEASPPQRFSPPPVFSNSSPPPVGDYDDLNQLQHQQQHPENQLIATSDLSTSIVSASCSPPPPPPKLSAGVGNLDDDDADFPKPARLNLEPAPNIPMLPNMSKYSIIISKSPNENLGKFLAANCVHILM